MRDESAGPGAGSDAFGVVGRQAGVEIVKPAQERFRGGYAGYFRDLDGYLWETAWNPAMLPDAS